MQRINLNGKDKAQETDVKVKSSIEIRIEAADVFWTKKRMIIKPKIVSVEIVANSELTYQNQSLDH